jgi:formylglycine-generating enzyme required for sulfatase activity
MRGRGVLSITVVAVLVAGSAVAVGGLLHRPPAPGGGRSACLAPGADGEGGEVWIPAGAYRMGSDGGAGRFAEETDRREVSVDGFWIDRTEVTNAQFAAFVAATGYVTVAERSLPGPDGQAVEPGAAVFVPPANVRDLVDITQWWRFVPGADWRHPQGPGSSIDGRDHHPVTQIAYEDAAAYAAWAGRALPSEAQWEWAARAGADDENWDEPRRPDGTWRANTWQGIFPVSNGGEDGYRATAPVGCFPPNARGLRDMVGNVWEWTSDLYQATGAGGPPQHVIKGGSYLCAPNYCARYRPTARQPADADLGTSHIGFRTIRTKPAGQGAAP